MVYPKLKISQEQSYDSLLKNTISGGPYCAVPTIVFPPNKSPFSSPNK